MTEGLGSIPAQYWDAANDPEKKVQKTVRPTKKVGEPRTRCASPAIEQNRQCRPAEAISLNPFHLHLHVHAVGEQWAWALEHWAAQIPPSIS